MVKYFKVNDPYRFAVLTIVFIIVRTFIFFTGTPLTQVELPYLVAARAVAGGGHWLYRDIWETTEPLTTLLYILLPKSAENFVIFSYWINILLLLFNSFYANHLLQKLDIFSEKSYLPAFFFLLLSLFFPELNVLSPQLLSSTSLLFVLSNVFSFLKKEDFYKMYDAGFFLGISSMFYLPSTGFLLAILLGLLFFTRSQSRSYFLVIIGFLLPWVLFSVLYLWIEGLDSFYNVFIQHYFTHYFNYTDSTDTLVVLGLPALLLASGIFFSKQGIVREINFQSVSRRFTLFWLLGGVFCCLISPFKSFSLLYLILFPAAFFYSYYYLQVKQFLIPNILVLIYTITCIYLQYRIIKGTIWQKSILEITVHQAENEIFKNKKIWVAGNKPEYYLSGSATGKYLNWEASKDDFENLNKFYAIENIRKSLFQDLPEVIVDETGVIPVLMNKIPKLKNYYVSPEKGIYLLQKK